MFTEVSLLQEHSPALQKFLVMSLERSNTTSKHSKYLEFLRTVCKGIKCPT